MKWVTKARETDDALLPIELVGDEAGDATAHRLATDDERHARRQRRHGSAIFIRQALGPGGRLSCALPSRRHVSKFEPVGGDTPLRQQPRNRREKWRLHARTGAMRAKKAHASICRACDHELGDRLPLAAKREGECQARGTPTIRMR